MIPTIDDLKQETLEEGLDDWVSLADIVHWACEIPGLDERARMLFAIQVARELAEAGYVRLGYVSKEDGWHYHSRSIDNVMEESIRGYDNKGLNYGAFKVWLENTPSGHIVAARGGQTASATTRE